ncbi:MAG: hypothetical protein ACK53Y_23880, partial [bacterium]
LGIQIPPPRPDGKPPDLACDFLHRRRRQTAGRHPRREHHGGHERNPTLGLKSRRARQPRRRRTRPGSRQAPA